MYATIAATALLVALGSAGPLTPRDIGHGAVLNPPQNPAEWAYQGCWAGDIMSLAHKASYVDEAGMTQQTCASFCGGHGLTAAGIHQGGECRCWDFMSAAPEHLKQLDETKCNLPCAGGDVDQACGASGEDHTVILVHVEAVGESETLWAEKGPEYSKAFGLDVEGCPKCPSCRPCPKPYPYPPRLPTLYPTTWLTRTTTSLWLAKHTFKHNFYDLIHWKYKHSIDEHWLAEYIGYINKHNLNNHIKYQFCCDFNKLINYTDKYNNILKHFNYEYYIAKHINKHTVNNYIINKFIAIILINSILEHHIHNTLKHINKHYITKHIDEHPNKHIKFIIQLIVRLNIQPIFKSVNYQSNNQLNCQLNCQLNYQPIDNQLSI
ncbi:hypothetical protein M406DRAFT_333015 [Cryphonectria parasitica EP155]|uniref:WSC domain-containing protein n=1 Tax=Cryphonectria parasitica (strain ATCC 38755 / EP155) TaxID=660469 RepID=A0A9P4XY33_CRYP1|nr:uncharacterized protein M406DRAFT_333015 [Cryphonectria parasitica EP155]KAF3762645.1 hypothetical protein M406DRAFT_333015 [Cryphonectria parasitica EP155]